MPQFNKVATEHLIDNLRTRADGKTVVDMRKEFGSTTLQVISWVCVLYTSSFMWYDAQFVQVAFGMDFSQDPYVQSLAGDKGLLFLLSNTLEGMMKSFRNPLQKVGGGI